MLAPAPAFPKTGQPKGRRGIIPGVLAANCQTETRSSGYAGGARGGGARLVLNQMSANAYSAADFRAAKRLENRDIGQAVGKVRQDFSDSLAGALPLHPTAFEKAG